MNKLHIGSLALLGGATIGGGLIIKLIVKPILIELTATKEMSSKHYKLYMLMNHWVKVKQAGRSIAAYFEQHGYEKIAIYGMNYVGETLLEELKKSNVKVICGIDNNAENIMTSVKVYTPNTFNEQVDAIVVTPITYFDEIENMLKEKVDCPIISVNDIIFEMSIS